MRPLLQSILIADKVYIDEQSKKYIIAGVFRVLYFIPQEKVKAHHERMKSEGKLRIPGGMQPGSPYVYINVTEVHGRQSLELRYVDLHDDQVYFHTSLEVKADNPLTNVELALGMPVLPTPHEGFFALELYWNNELLGLHRIQLIEAEISEEKDNGTDS